MILRLLLILAIVIVAILAYAASKPPTLIIQRPITINAAPEKVFALVNDFHNWPKWNPQDREDPALTRTYRGPASGQNSISDWSGKGDSGEGTLTITESTPNAKISIDAAWTRPFQTHNINDFEFTPAGAATKVTWTLRATNLYMMKVMAVFTDMDKNIGTHLDSGLKNLKSVAESRD
jgi:uncharacterized protein YndB with AHSA1/START domain